MLARSTGGLVILILYTVQDTSGQWCVERVMERETLSSNTELEEDDGIKESLV